MTAKQVRFCAVAACVGLAASVALADPSSGPSVANPYGQIDVAPGDFYVGAAGGVSWMTLPGWEYGTSDLGSPIKPEFEFDGDGSLLMNLGSLVTIANAAPQNFHHFVFENGVYEVNGAHPIPGNGKLDFAAMAKAAGYQQVETFSDLEVFESSVGEFLKQPGPALAVMKIEAGESYPRDYQYIHGAEARRRFKQALQSS